MLQEAIKIGINYESGEAKQVVLSSDGGAVQGVETEAGNVLRADKVVLATGAWTSKLLSSLEDSLEFELTDRIERQVSAAGVCVAHFQLSDEERELYSKLPVFVYGGQGTLHHEVSYMMGVRID
jgi:sarcosine oxidase/L-pipecolate oxidase